MTLPESLVQAAAEAPCIREGTEEIAGNPWKWPCDGMEFKHPECSLAAAFGALLGCEEAKTVVTKELFRDGGVMAWLLGSLDGRKADPNEQVARVALAALAREFGAPT